jgi:EmrB/QacA subfamily drug resistance transporter
MSNPDNSIAIGGTDSTAAKSRAKSRILVVASLVSSLIMLDSNVLAVSLPSIARSLGASFTDIEWVVSSYILTYASLLLAAGSYADLHGRRKTMVAGLVIFALASLACGLAGNVLLLNVSRAGQGVGGALLLTSSLAIIGHEFSGAERARAFAFWGASLGVALAVGPILGGAIAHFLGWRWIFLINLPLCVVLTVAAFQTTPESIDPRAQKLDFRGIATFSAGLALLIWALIDGNELGWGDGPILLRLSTAGLLFALFVREEYHQARPMVDLGLFRRPTFVGAVAAMIGYGASAQVMIFFLPLYLQNAYGFQPLVAGVAMIPFAFPMVLAPRIFAGLGVRFSGRTILTVGLIVTLVGNLSFWAAARTHLSYAMFLLPMLVAGCGAGLLNGETVKVLGGAVPPERAGMAGGLAGTTRFVGILVSIAGLGAVLSSMSYHTFVRAAVAIGIPPEAARVAARQAASGNLAEILATFPDSIRPKLQALAQISFAQGFAAAALVAAGVAAVAGALTFMLVRRADTLPLEALRAPPSCFAIDCRHPL